MMNIYLCGFMGCGKTHIGKRLAKQLKMNFVDLDNYITSKENRTIPQIFAENGEAYFRQTEAACIKELGSGYVVATGGGALLNPETARFANENGAVVFLNAPFSLCYQRIQNDKNRPLVVSSTKEQLYELFVARRDVYKAHARYTVRTDGRVKATIARIIRKLNSVCEVNENVDL